MLANNLLCPVASTLLANNPLCRRKLLCRCKLLLCPIASYQAGCRPLSLLPSDVSSVKHAIGQGIVH